LDFNKRKVNVDWDLVFQDDDILLKKVIKSRLLDHYDISNRTADNYIKEDLVSVGYGKYKRPEECNNATP